MLLRYTFSEVHQQRWKLCFIDESLNSGILTTDDRKFLTRPLPILSWTVNAIQLHVSRSMTKDILQLIHR